MVESEASVAAEPKKCLHAWSMIDMLGGQFVQPCMTPGCNATRWVKVKVEYVLEVRE